MGLTLFRTLVNAALIVACLVVAYLTWNTHRWLCWVLIAVAALNLAHGIWLSVRASRRAGQRQAG
jgi:bacteriorhodopsin